MGTRVLILLAGFGLIGFLLFPRQEPVPSPGLVDWVPTARLVEDEPLRFPRIFRTEPIYQTVDLGFVYRIDRVQVTFEQPTERGPKQFEVLVSRAREGEYQRALAFRSSSRSYPWSVQRFPAALEARWVQIVVNDWFSDRPKIQEVRVGPAYRRDWNPIVRIDASHNRAAASLLVDGLRGEASKWSGAQVVEETVRQEGEKRRVRQLLPPHGPVWVLADLGGARRVYGVRVTTNGPDTNVRRFTLHSSLDGKVFSLLHRSEELPDTTQEVQVLFERPVSTRFIRLEVPPDGWYGRYPELEEFEVFTEDYRPYSGPVEPMVGGGYNPVLVRYDNCGIDVRRSPHLVQGFPFDRGSGDSALRYGWIPNEEVEGEPPEPMRTFAYHYDTVRLRYAGLDPNRLYWLQLTALQNKNGGRIQAVVVDGYLLEEEWVVPTGAAEPRTFFIPPPAVADGQIEVALHRLAGPNAVLSEAALYSAVPAGKAVPGAGLAEAKALHTDVPPRIDGDLSDWFQRFPLRSTDGGIESFLEWNQDGLFVALRVPTERLPAARFEDSLDLFFDTTLSRSPSLYQPGDLHLHLYRFGTGSEIARLVPHYSTAGLVVPDRPPPVTQAGLRRGGIYSLELFLPREGLLTEWNPQEEGRIGFNFIVTTHRGKRWYLRAENPEDPPIQWQTVRLWGSPRATLNLYAQPPPGAGEPWNPAPTSTLDAGDRLWILLRDPDVSTDPTRVESVQVELLGGLSGVRRTVTLREVRFPDVFQAGLDAAQASDSQYFAGVVPTVFGDQVVGGNFPVRGDEALVVTYRDPMVAPGGRSEPVQAEIRGRSGVTGAVYLLDAEGRSISQFRAGDRLRIRVEDPDLAVEIPTPPASQEGTPSPRTLRVLVRSRDVDATEPFDQVDLVLTEVGPNVFSGEFATVYSPEPDRTDSRLQVRGTQEVQVVYLDRIQETGRTRVPMVVSARVAIGSTAQLRLRTPRGVFPPAGEPVLFLAGTPLIVSVWDNDLNQDSAVPDRATVEVRTEQTGDRLTLTLEEAGPNSSRFLALLPTRFGPTADPNNAVLEVVGRDTVTVQYVDAIQGSGATQVPVEATARAAVGNDGTLRFVGPDYLQVVSRINPTDVLYLRVEDPDESGDELSVVVRTAETGDQETVRLGSTSTAGTVYVGPLPTGYGRQAVPEDGLLTVVGNDRITATYTDRLRASGETNRPVTASVSVNVGHDGTLSVYRRVPGTGMLEPVGELFRAGETLLIEVRDPDLNALSEVIEQVAVRAQNSATGDQVDVLLRETSGNSGVFQGELVTEFGPPARDTVLQVDQDSVIVLQYTDAIQASGAVQIPVRRYLGLELGTRGELHLLTLDGSRELTTFGPGDTILVRVVDPDLNQDPKFSETTAVWIQGSIWNDALELPLRETGPNTGTFEARLVAEWIRDPDQVQPEDLLLQIGAGEVVTVIYTDALDKTGEPNVLYARRVVAAAEGERTLLLLDEQGEEVGTFLAGTTLFLRLRDPLRLVWAQLPPPVAEIRGNRTGDSVQVSLDPVPGEPGVFSGRVPTAYGVVSRANEVLEVQGGEEVLARYRGPDKLEIVDLALVARGTRGRVQVVREDGSPRVVLTPGEPLTVRVEDTDQNRTATVRETVQVRVHAGESTAPWPLTLEETDVDSGVFVGALQTTLGTPEQESNRLTLWGGEVLQIVYLDPLVETGATNVEVDATCPVRRVAFAPFTEEEPIVDGYPEGWPLTYGLRMPERNAFVWAQWSRDALYFFIQIAQERPRVRDVTRWYAGSDAVEIHLTPLTEEDVSPSYLSDPGQNLHYVYWICPLGGGLQGDQPYVGRARPTLQYNVREVQVVARVRDGMYFLEVRIPFARGLGGFDPWVSRRRNRIAFNLLVYRSDGPQQWWANPPSPDVPPSWGGLLYLLQPGEEATTMLGTDEF